MSNKLTSEVNIEDIIRGRLLGATLWICDFRYKNYSNKPIRYIEPTMVSVADNDTTDKPIYYSVTHFREFNKNGTLKSTPIPIFDSTGYRAYPGEPVKVFVLKEDCIQEFKNLATKALKDLKKHEKELLKDVKIKIKQAEEIIKNY